MRLIMTDDYSVNMSTLFYIQKTPTDQRRQSLPRNGRSGKSYAVVNRSIKQQIEKGFSMYIYDFMFDGLSVNRL